jgi:hypothetical protein
MRLLDLDGDLIQLVDTRRKGFLVAFCSSGVVMSIWWKCLKARHVMCKYLGGKRRI